MHRDETVVAFHDLRPVAPTHVLIIPTRHVASLLQLQAGDDQLLGAMFSVAWEIARSEAVDADGYRLVINTGPAAGQSVFHLHMHLLAGRPMRWPPG